MARPDILTPKDNPFPDDDALATPMSGSALAVLNRSEIEQQIEIAKKYPRSVEKFRATLKKYSTLNAPIALTMFYTLKRRSQDGTDKLIPGPSVRFAETALTSWGNARAGTRLLGEQDGFTVAQGVFFDCETNVGISVESARSIMSKNSRRFSQDMVVVTSNAAASIAYRNAILRGIPRGLYLDIYEETKLTAVGEAKSFGQQVQAAVEEFSKQGVTQVALLNVLGAPSIRDITAEHILSMRVMFREIRDGEKTIEDVFGSKEDDEINALMVELGWSATKQRMSIEHYKGNRSGHLEYLREQVKKMGGTTATTTPSATEAVKDEPKPATEPQPELKLEPEPAEAKPAAKKTNKPAW